jgi:hypothetical protein
VVSFPWSNAGFAQVCRYETKECLCEALMRIFMFIGGVISQQFSAQFTTYR